LHLVPERRALKRKLHDFVELAPRRIAIDTWPVCNVVVDGFRKWIRSLKHHAYSRSQFDDIGLGAVDILAVKQNVALVTHARNRLVHAIDSAEKSRPSATVRADLGCDR